MESQKLTLGQPVSFDATFERKCETRYMQSDRLTWNAKKHPAKKGIVVGTRTIWNGENNYEHLDQDQVYTYFTFGQPVKAVLVAYAMGRNPVLVPVDSIMPQA